VKYYHILLNEEDQKKLKYVMKAMKHRDAQGFFVSALREAWIKV